MGSSPEVWPMMSLSLTTSGVPVKLQLHFFVSSTVVDHASLPVFMSSAMTRPSSVPKNTLPWRSEEHTSELQSQSNLVCRLLLEKKNMTPSMLANSRAGAEKIRLQHVEFLEGLIEQRPLEYCLADVVITIGVLYLVPYKLSVWRQ